jgi:hypothetical protein
MSDSEGSNFSDNESERGSNQHSDSDVEVTTCSHKGLLANTMLDDVRSWLLQTYVV